MRSRSSVSVKWWGQASAVTLTPRRLPSRTSSTERAVEMCWMCSRPRGDLGEADVAGDHDVLGGVWHAGKSQSHRLETLVHDAAHGELGHLAVLHDHAVEHLGVLEGAAHQGGRGDRCAVVGEGHGTTGDKLAKTRPALRPCGPCSRRLRDRRWPGERAGLGARQTRRRPGCRWRGFVLGMQATDVTPPARAAAAPVAMVSSSSLPGSRRWT